MKKNMNENFEITVDEMTEIFGDTPVEMSFREVKDGMDSFFGLMGLTVELVNLIRKEDELKKHHRAYLHVREEIAECANEATEVIGGILDSIQEKEHIYRVSGSPSAFDMDEEDEYEDDFVTIPVPFPVSWTVKMKKKQKETQDILSYHTQAAGCSDKARAKASGGRQPIEECGRTGL